MENILISTLTAGAIVPVVNHLVEIARPFVKDNRFLPVIALVLGVGVSVLIGLVHDQGPGAILDAVIGLIGTGLAIGNYEKTKDALRQRESEKTIPDYEGKRI